MDRNFISNYPSSIHSNRLLLFLTTFREEAALVTEYLTIQHLIAGKDIIKAKELINDIRKSYNKTAFFEKTILLEAECFPTADSSEKIKFLEKFLKKAHFSSTKEDIIKMLGDTYRELNNIENAEKYYSRLLTDFPDSIYLFDIRRILNSR